MRRNPKVSSESLSSAAATCASASPASAALTAAMRCSSPSLGARLLQQNGAAGELPRFDLAIWALI
jgi:hypothetical protein